MVHSSGTWIYLGQHTYSHGLQATDRNHSQETYICSSCYRNLLPDSDTSWQPRMPCPRNMLKEAQGWTGTTTQIRSRKPSLISEHAKCTCGHGEEHDYGTLLHLPFLSVASPAIYLSASHTFGKALPVRLHMLGLHICDIGWRQ